jgi:hypothetical protein
VRVSGGDFAGAGALVAVAAGAAVSLAVDERGAVFQWGGGAGAFPRRGGGVETPAVQAAPPPPLPVLTGQVSSLPSY